MPLFVAEHRHPADRCPAQSPQMGTFLLDLLSPSKAGTHGLAIEAEAVARGQHHLYLIVRADDEATIRNYLAPLAQAGSLEVSAASTCEDVVGRGSC